MFHCNSVSPELVISSSDSINYIHPGVQGAGDVRINTGSRKLEVYTGYNWEPVVNTIYAGLTPETSAVIAWARNKMHEEQKINELAKSNVAVQASLDNVNRATEQLKTTIILANNEETTS